jgi:ATP-dependent Clp protease protease subunit
MEAQMRNRLLQLLADNRRPFEPIQNKIQAKAGEAAIYLYDPIVGDRLTAEWWGGICPQDFVPAVRALEADHITLYTNCPGGDVFAAEAMCQALREHSAKVTMQIEGYAASAATALACACDEVVATPASKYMIHQTWTFALGNARELLQVVDLLNKCDETMYGAYDKRTGQTRDQIVEWCEAETWFTAEEAVAAGFVDSVLQTASARASASPKWNLSAYARAPEPQDVAPPGAPSQPDHTFASADHRARQQQRLQMLARLAFQ